MLSLLASALLLTGRVLGQQVCVTGATGKTQSGTNNYVIDYFSSTLLFSYAIDQCTGVDLLDDTKYVKYTCTELSDDTWTVTKSTYTNKACTGTPTTETWYDTEEAGQYGYFECDGDSNYAQVQITTDSACGTTLTVYGGLGGCAQNPMSFDTKFYCDSTSALVQLYYTNNGTMYDMCDDDNLYCNTWTFTSTCALSAKLGNIPVYGKMVSCMTGVTTSTTGSATTTMMTTSSATTFNVLGAIVALVVGLFY